MKWIVQFVLKQFAKRSDKKTGVAKLLNETDPIVQSNVRNIEIQLKNLGINPEDLTSTDDVLKALNYHNALMNQHLKQQFKGLGLRKGVDDLAKTKDPFQGWTPKVVKKEGIKQRMDKIKGLSDELKKLEDERFALYGKKPLTEAEIKERILRENKEAAERLRKKKEDPEDFFASGGIARAGFKNGGMDRRGFLKLMGGLAALPVVGKFFKWAKPLSKASGVITRGTDGIPTYVPDLIKVVKAKGAKEITEGLYKRSPPVHKWNYKGVEVAEDGMGNTSVRKNMEETKSWNTDNDVIIEDVVDREIGFEIRKGETVTSKKGQPIQTPDEYTENTAYMQGDPEGGVDVSDLAEVIEDADHLELKRIADESLIKKAEGGRASYTKGGLAHVLGV
jgi:hypothetical protein